MAYKQSPFPLISGASGHRSALKQVVSATAEGKEKTKMVEGTTIFGKTLPEWNAIILKYTNKPDLSKTAQSLLSKARNAVSKLKK